MGKKTGKKAVSKKVNANKKETTTPQMKKKQSKPANVGKIPPAVSTAIQEPKMGTPANTSKKLAPREERNWAMYCHLAGFLGFIFPFGNIVGPLVVWLIKREEYPSIDKHGKEALNYQISMTIYFLVSFLLMFVAIGILLVGALVVLQLIFIIMAAVKAQEGGFYRYPITIRFIK